MEAPAGANQKATGNNGNLHIVNQFPAGAGNCKLCQVKKQEMKAE
jgi:hypothetical protein